LSSSAWSTVLGASPATAKRRNETDPEANPIGASSPVNTTARTRRKPGRGSYHHRRGCYRQPTVDRAKVRSGSKPSPGGRPVWRGRDYRSRAGPRRRGRGDSAGRRARGCDIRAVRAC
jgi:hypothetical protein